jgi:hypothetical protein
VDINHYALEILVRERIARARAEAAGTRRVPPASPPRRRPVRVRVGLALIALGRWVRGVPDGGVLVGG